MRKKWMSQEEGHKKQTFDKGNFEIKNVFSEINNK